MERLGFTLLSAYAGGISGTSLFPQSLTASVLQSSAFFTASDAHEQRLM